MASKYIVTRAQREAGAKEGKSVRDIVRSREQAARSKKASKSKKKSKSTSVQATPRAAAIIEALAKGGDTKAQKIQQKGVSTTTPSITVKEPPKPKKKVTPTPVAVLSPRVAQAIAEAPKSEQERLLREKGIVQVKAAGARISRDYTLKETAPTKTRFIPEQLDPGPVVRSKIKKEIKTQGVSPDLAKEFTKGKDTKAIVSIVGQSQAQARAATRAKQSGKLTASEFQKEIKDIQGQVDTKVAGINLRLKAEAGQPTEVVDTRPTQAGFSLAEVEQIGKEQKLITKSAQIAERQEKVSKDVKFISIIEQASTPTSAGNPFRKLIYPQGFAATTISLGATVATGFEKTVAVGKAFFSGTFASQEGKQDAFSRLATSTKQVGGKAFSTEAGVGLAQPAVVKTVFSPRSLITAGVGALVISAPKLDAISSTGAIRPSKTTLKPSKALKGQKTLTQTFKKIETTAAKPTIPLFKSKGTRSVKPRVQYFDKGTTGIKAPKTKPSGTFVDPKGATIARIAPKTKTGPQTRLTQFKTQSFKQKAITGKEAVVVETEFGSVYGRETIIQKTPAGTRVTITDRAPRSLQIAYTKPSLIKTNVVPLKKGISLFKSKSAQTRLISLTKQVSTPTRSIIAPSTALSSSSVAGASSLITGTTSSFGLAATGLAFGFSASIGSRVTQPSTIDSAISSRQAQPLIQLPRIKIATQQRGISQSFSSSITESQFQNIAQKPDTKVGSAVGSGTIQSQRTSPIQTSIFQTITPILPVIPVVAGGLIASQVFRQRKSKKKTIRPDKEGNEGGGLMGSFKSLGFTRRVTKYTPSLIAVALDITGKKLKGPKFGLRIRPVIK